MTPIHEGLIEEITALPLHDRSARRRAILIADKYITTSCSSSDIAESELSGALQTAVGGVIGCLLDYHDNAQQTNGGVCRLGKYHQIMHIAAVVAFKWKLNSTPMICRLLSTVASCEGTLERLFAPSIFGTRVTYLVSGSKSDLDSQQECLNLAEFFLNHACRADLRVTVNYDQNNRKGWERTYRVVDLPLLSYDAIPPLHAAVRIQQTPAVRLFLHCGADLCFIPVSGDCDLFFDEDSRYKPIHYLCRSLNAETQSHILEGIPYSEAAIQCLRHLLRVCVTKTPLCVTSAAGGAETDTGLHYTILAQEPRLAALMGVRSLRHLARCAVRSRLREVGRLPGGVKSLPVPDSMRIYVDLVDD